RAFADVLGQRLQRIVNVLIMFFKKELVPHLEATGGSHAPAQLGEATLPFEVEVIALSGSLPVTRRRELLERTRCPQRGLGCFGDCRKVGENVAHAAPPFLAASTNSQART